MMAPTSMGATSYALISTGRADGLLNAEIDTQGAVAAALGKYR
jgi:hypothetical protein